MIILFLIIDILFLSKFLSNKKDESLKSFLNLNHNEKSLLETQDKIFKNELIDLIADDSLNKVKIEKSEKIENVDFQEQRKRLLQINSAKKDRIVTYDQLASYDSEISLAYQTRLKTMKKSRYADRGTEINLEHIGENNQPEKKEFVNIENDIVKGIVWHTILETKI